MIIVKRKMVGEREREVIFDTTASWVSKKSKFIATAKSKRAYLLVSLRRTHDHNISLGTFLRKKKLWIISM